MKLTSGPFLSTLLLGAPGAEAYPSASRKIDVSVDDAQSIAAWARAAAGDLLEVVPETVAHAVTVVAHALADDALTRGRPPLDIRVTATPTTIEIAVSGARSIAQRSLSHDVPALIEARKFTTNWTTRLGPTRHGSIVTAAIPLQPRRRPSWLHTRRGR